MGPPGWVIGVVVASGTFLLATHSRLAAPGIVGVLIPPALAFWAGAAAASIVDSRRGKNGINTFVVAGAVVMLLVAYLLMLQSRPAPPGTSFGGPNVYPSQPGASKSGPKVPPP